MLMRGYEQFACHVPASLNLLIVLAIIAHAGRCFNAKGRESPAQPLALQGLRKDRLFLTSLPFSVQLL